MKIGFKKKSDIDFKKVFPIIEEAEYSLIEPLTLILTDSEYKKAISNGFIVLGNKQVSSSLIEISSEAQKDHVKEEISKKIQEKNIYFQEVTDAIFLGVELKKNVLLYGRGGHNKSEGTLQILSLMKDNGLITTDPFIISFGDGLTEESLLGGINIKKFKDTGELEYLFKNSFMESEIVIIEEIFDAPPQVLLSLKDILTSGECRKGNQSWKSKTKVVIALTNKSKEEFAEDDSLEALTQRFTLTNKVEWDSYGKKDWRALFSVVFDRDFNEKNKYKLSELVEILDQNHLAKKTFCSPRTAVHAAQIYCAGGSLEFISDIDKEVLKNFYAANKNREQEERDEQIFKLIDSYISSNNLEKNSTYDELRKIVSKEHEARSGEKIVFDEKITLSNASKVDKLEFVAGILSCYSFSAKNNKLAIDKIKYFRESANKIKS